MLYQICPRCHFRLQVSRHICSTCGHVFQTKKNGAEEVAVNVETELKPEPRSFWKMLFGIQEPAKELHEEPAQS